MWFCRRKRRRWVKESKRPRAAAREAITASAENNNRQVWYVGLERLRGALTSPLIRLARSGPLDETVREEVEGILLAADVGVQTTAVLVERILARSRRSGHTEAGVLLADLKDEMLAILRKAVATPVSWADRPFVILVVGINGVGKTTTIAKLARRFLDEGKSVLLVAADTFRAAAAEQLSVWASRLGVDVVKHRAGASPAAIVHDGLQAALARQVDVVIIDTAGRLHTKAPLMEELKKIRRVASQNVRGAPHETFIVLDATTGQNAISQAYRFQQALPLSGIVLSKMDGSAKGGAILPIAASLGLPIRYLSFGESERDLQEFDAGKFVEALFSPLDAPTSLDA